MYNFNSPVIQNMVGGYNIPPSPIGATTSIGGTGYNANYGYMGGYYNNNYMYYNPYLAARQQEIALAKQREYQRQAADSMKALTKSAYSSMGMEVDDQVLNIRYDPKDVQTLSSKDQKYYELCKLSDPTVSMQRDSMKTYYQNMLYDQYKAANPDDISLADFFNNANKELMNIGIQELKTQSKAGISNLYNSNQYRQVIQMNSNGGGYFSNMYNNNPGGEISISDMSVQIPGAKPTPYSVRRKAFIDAIMNNRR